MSNDKSYFAEILIQDELNRQAQARGQELANHRFQIQRDEFIQEISSLKKQLEKSDRQKNELNLDIEHFKKKINFYEDLLGQSFESIARQNQSFRIGAYEERELILADWMVSQKAFKELAIQFGEKLGISLDEVVNMGMNGKLDVLRNVNNPSHNTNCADSKVIGPRRDILIEEYSSFRKEYDNLIKRHELYTVPQKTPVSWDNAFKSWLTLAENNDGKAQYNIGYCYQYGVGVIQDLHLAVNWHQKSFEQGDACAAHNLFLIFSDEKYQDCDLIKALEYLRFAIDRGDPRAELTLDRFLSEQEKEKQKGAMS